MTIFLLLLLASVCHATEVLFSTLNRTHIVLESHCRLMCHEKFNSPLFATLTRTHDPVSVLLCEETCSVLLNSWGTSVWQLMCSGRQCGKGCSAACAYTVDAHKTTLNKAAQKWCRFATPLTIVNMGTTGAQLQWELPQMFNGRWCTNGLIDYTILHRASSYSSWTVADHTMATELDVVNGENQWMVMAVDKDGLLTETRSLIYGTTTTTTMTTTPTLGGTTPTTTDKPEQLFGWSNEETLIYLVIFGFVLLFIFAIIVCVAVQCVSCRQRRESNRTLVYPVRQVHGSRVGSIASQSVVGDAKHRHTNSTHLPSSEEGEEENHYHVYERPIQAAFAFALDSRDYNSKYAGSTFNDSRTTATQNESRAAYAEYHAPHSMLGPPSVTHLQPVFEAVEDDPDATISIGQSSNYHINRTANWTPYAEIDQMEHLAQLPIGRQQRHRATTIIGASNHHKSGRSHDSAPKRSTYLSHDHHDDTRSQIYTHDGYYFDPEVHAGRRVTYTSRHGQRRGDYDEPCYVTEERRMTSTPIGRMMSGASIGGQRHQAPTYCVDDWRTKHAVPLSQMHVLSPI